MKKMVIIIGYSRLTLRWTVDAQVRSGPCVEPGPYDNDRGYIS